MRTAGRFAFASALLFLPLSSSSGAEKADLEKIVALGREESRVMEHLDVLVNRIGPRLTGSDNLQNACEWAKDRFRSFGIENARLEKWGEFPVGFNRGPWSGRMVEPESKTLTFGTNAWTAGTRGVVRGKAVMAPETPEQLDQVRDQLPGAWVLVPRTRERLDAEFRKARDEAYAGAGVAGFVRPTRGELIVTSGNHRIRWDDIPTTPMIDLVQPQFEEIAALLKDGKPVVLEFDVRNYFKNGPIPQYNVIADIPGVESPDEYVIVGGHIDSWDAATGTTDNGTGCATTLEAARLLMKAGVKPRRTIRFMLWSGEEQGLLGSQAYVRANADLMPRISAVVVHDGGTNYLSGIGVTKAMRADMEEVFSPVMGLDPDMPFAIRDVPGLRGGGSDHASFLAAGVPGFFWGQAGKAVYRNTHHTQHDTFDAAVPEYQRHSSIVVALAALGIADLDHLLSREGMTAPGGANRRVAGVQLDELKVVEVVPESIAEKGGIKPGDVFVKVDGKEIADREAFTAALQAGPPTKKVVVQREGKDVELTLTFPGRP